MKKIKEYALTTLGIVLTAIALEYFFFPNDIAAGGVSGIALVINGVTGWNISIMVFILNIILFILAFVVLGKGFGGKSIYATVMLSVVMEIIERVFSPGILTDNMFLASFFGSALLAMGSAIVFHQGASTGGTSILAAIISKFTPLGVGTALLSAFEKDESGKLIYLYTDNACTYQFYEHRGFERSEERQVVLDLDKRQVPLTCLFYTKKITEQ